jgi:hypothetical protein
MSTQRAFIRQAKRIWRDMKASNKTAPQPGYKVTLDRVKVIGKILNGHFIEWQRAITKGDSVYVQFTDGSFHREEAKQHRNKKERVAYRRSCGSRNLAMVA